MWKQKHKVTNATRGGEKFKSHFARHKPNGGVHCVQNRAAEASEEPFTRQVHVRVTDDTPHSNLREQTQQATWNERLTATFDST